MGSGGVTPRKIFKTCHEFLAFCGSLKHIFFKYKQLSLKTLEEFSQLFVFRDTLWSRTCSDWDSVLFFKFQEMSGYSVARGHPNSKMYYNVQMSAWLK